MIVVPYQYAPQVISLCLSSDRSGIGNRSARYHHRYHLRLLGTVVRYWAISAAEALSADQHLRRLVLDSIFHSIGTDLILVEHTFHNHV